MSFQVYFYGGSIQLSLNDEGNYQLDYIMGLEDYANGDFYVPGEIVPFLESFGTKCTFLRKDQYTCECMTIPYWAY